MFFQVTLERSPTVYVRQLPLTLCGRNGTVQRWHLYLSREPGSVKDYSVWNLPSESLLLDLIIPVGIISLGLVSVDCCLPLCQGFISQGGIWQGLFSRKNSLRFQQLSTGWVIRSPCSCRSSLRLVGFMSTVLFCGASGMKEAVTAIVGLSQQTDCAKLRYDQILCGHWCGEERTF